MARQILSAENLLDLLEREFQRFRATECVMVCRVPAPVFHESPEAGQANWYVEPPPRCPRYCNRLIEAVVSRIAGRYDVERPQGLPPGSRASGRGEAEQAPS
jgi:hypothetical protein